MIIVDYRLLGLLRSKRVFFADQLPETDGFHFVACHTYLDMPFPDPFVCYQKSTILIDLTQDSDRIFSQIHKKRRNIIIKGSRIGFSFILERPTLRHLKDYRLLHNKYLVSKGIEPLITLDFLKALSGNMTVCIGQRNDQTMIIMLVINDGNIARNLFIARNQALIDKRESYYVGSTLQWEVFAHYKRLGYKAYDMGGLIGEPPLSIFGVDQYKISYGGEISPNYYFEAAFTPAARLLVSSKPIIRNWFRRFKKVPFRWRKGGV